MSVEVSRCARDEPVLVPGSRLGQHVPVGTAHGHGNCGK